MNLESPEEEGLVCITFYLDELHQSEEIAAMGWSCHGTFHPPAEFSLPYR